MRVLTVPNWSFGRDRDLLSVFGDLLSGWEGLRVHYLRSDVDHNRTVSAFSGPADRVFERLERLAEAAFERIDLNRHSGVHPRVGALDVCPFLRLGSEPYPLQLKIEAFAAGFAEKFGVPVFLYEQSERGRHAADLPTLRKGGFGGMLLKDRIEPDFGPSQPHPRLGATIMGERPWLLAFNLNFYGDDLAAAKLVAKEIRTRRAEGDSHFQFVRALGFYLTSREMVQVSLNVTRPELTPLDPLIERVTALAGRFGLQFAETELIGVIRSTDAEWASRLRIDSAQIVSEVP